MARGVPAIGVLVRNGRRVPGCRVRIAATWWQRAVGLLATRQLDDPRGLWIAPCRSVHTFCMRYSIDLVFVSPRGKVLKLVPRLQPWRAAGCRGAEATLELRAGAIDELGLKVGDSVACQ